MVKIKIKIQDLFHRLDLDKTPNSLNPEISWKNDFGNIRIKTPTGDFTNINEFVKKCCDSYKITFNNGNILICSNKHILKTNNGLKKIKDINKDDIIENINGDFLKIDNIEFLKKHTTLYDVCIDSPHLFIDTGYMDVKLTVYNNGCPDDT